MCGTSAKIAIQTLAEFEPRAQQPGFYRGNRNAERFGGLLSGKLFNVAQHENNAKIRFQIVDDFAQDFVHFLLGEPFFWTWPPFLKLTCHQFLLASARPAPGNSV